MITTDPSKAPVWVVPMNHINFNALEGLRRKKGGRSRVVAFLPTGWTHNSASGYPKGGRNGGNNTNTNTKTKTNTNTKGATEKETGSKTDSSSQPTSSSVKTREKDGNVIYSVWHIKLL